MRKFGSLLLAGVIGGLVFFLANQFFFQGRTNLSSKKDFRQVDMQKVSLVSPVPAAVPDFIDAAASTVHAVVHIKAELKQRNQVYNSFFDIFNNRPRYYDRSYFATGSGVIISDDGYIVTNNHVVQNAFRLEVTLNDKRTYEAEVIGTDPSTDLALIKIHDDHFPYLDFGNSDNVRVGEWVLAVGNPFNLTSTVTAGIVSAKARNINILGSNSAIESFIQTDAAVNPGNSGGALVNSLGQLIGINAAIASNTGSYAGYSFAIPSNLVKKVIFDLKDYGETQRAYLGIKYAEIDAQLAELRGLDSIRGISVEGVFDNSAADKAGIEPGDIIIKIDGKVINSQSELTETLGIKHPGDKVNIVVVRDNIPIVKEVILENGSGSTALFKRNRIEIIGATFETLSADELAKLDLDNGFRIKNIKNGILKSAGIREGFIITEVNNHPVRSLDELQELIRNNRGGILIEGMYENGRRAYYGFGL
jgi:Do/DeqQ family serine protease